MPRILLLIPSTSYRARDFLRAAAALGVEVVVGSDHRQVLAAFGGAGTLQVDLHDVDRGVARIVAHARAHPVDAVLGTDDESTVLAAAAARALALPHDDPEAVAAARDKHRFRLALSTAGVPCPGFGLLDLRGDLAAQAREVRYPCVVKPRSLAGSRGVIRTDDPAALAAACRRIGDILRGVSGLAAEEHRHTLLVEDYLPGDEVAVEGLLHEGGLLVLAVLDKPDPPQGPTFEETLLVTPSRLPDGRRCAIARTVARAAAALGLRRGPVHAELRVNDAGDWMLELAPRSIGGLCSRALRFAGDATLESLILRSALGLAPRETRLREGASGVLMIPVPRGGRLHGVGGIDAARRVAGVEEVVVSIPEGDAVAPLPEGDRYLGFVFARAPTPGEVECALRAAHGCLDVRIG